MPIDDYRWSVRINYAPNVVNECRKLDQQNADRAKFNAIKDRWSTASDFTSVKGTMLKAVEISSRYESKTYSTKYGINKTTGKMPGVKSAEVMTRYGKVSAASAARSIKILGNSVGVLGVIFTSGEAISDGRFSGGDAFKVIFSRQRCCLVVG